MYLRGKIEELLDKNIDKLTGSISYRAFVGRLKKVFKDDTLCFKYQKYDGINVDDYSISGIFDMNKNKRYVVMHFSHIPCLHECGWCILFSSSTSSIVLLAGITNTSPVLAIFILNSSLFNIIPYNEQYF